MTHQPDELTQWMESLSWEFDQSLNIWCGPDGQSFLMPDQAAFFHSHLTKELAKQNSHEHDLKATQCDPDCKCDLIHLYCSKCSYIDVADGWEGCNSSLDEKLAKRDIDTMKEWNDMLDRAANGEVVKLTRNGIELTINSLDGMHDGMSRVVNTAMALGAEIEKRNNPNPKTLTHKHNKENK